MVQIICDTFELKFHSWKANRRPVKPSFHVVLGHTYCINYNQALYEPWLSLLVIVFLFLSVPTATGIVKVWHTHVAITITSARAATENAVTTIALLPEEVMEEEKGLYIGDFEMEVAAAVLE